MSLFSRVRGFIRSVISTDASEEIQVEEAILEAFGEEDELVEIWHEVVEENLSGDIHELREFTLDQHGAELFKRGWVDDGEDTDERVNAREEFFELMEAYDISREEFDWDAWRDWYKDA